LYAIRCRSNGRDEEGGVLTVVVNVEEVRRFRIIF
jgi:hypothetical protein